MSTQNHALTRKQELVETDNLAKSIARLRNGNTWDERWKRALLHAVMMECSRGEAEKIRLALDLA